MLVRTKLDLLSVRAPPAAQARRALPQLDLRLLRLFFFEA
jgi:hypothetical protein